MTNLQHRKTTAVDHTCNHVVPKLYIFLSLEVIEDGNEGNGQQDKSDDIPWYSFPLLHRNIPILVSHLSDISPTRGVVMPSATCPTINT